MREIDNITLKSLQLDILREVDFFCTANNLTYYMSYGTLLGAVRHKGYIPWDDDIDITMPYPDYIKFCDSFFSENYKVNVWFKQPEFFCNFAKVEDVRTLQIEEVNSKVQIGINIDVTPLIGLPDKMSEAIRHFRKIQRYRDILHLKQMKLRRGRRIDKQLVLIISKLFTGLISFKHINSIIDKLLRKYDYANSTRVVSVGTFNESNEIIEKEQLGKTTRLAFEGEMFCAPEGYDAWLREIFGKYMELPPIEKRVTHHGFKCYWKL